jgi:hypothetical protein
MYLILGVVAMDIESNIDPIKLNKIVDACRELRKMPGYPYSDDKDIPFIKNIVEELPSLDLVAEIKQWHIWLLDNQDKVYKKKVNHRSRLRRWCLNSAKWKANKGYSQKQRQQVKNTPQYEFENKRQDEGKTKFEEVW